MEAGNKTSGLKLAGDCFLFLDLTAAGGDSTSPLTGLLTSSGLDGRAGADFFDGIMTELDLK